MKARTRLMITTQAKAFVDRSTKYITIDKLLRSAHWCESVENEIVKIAFELWYKGEIDEEITLDEVREIFDALIYNGICVGCANLRNGCSGEIDNSYTGCIYRKGR